MTIFLRLLAVILFLIGLLAGGCSLFVTPIVFQDGDMGVTPIWLAGFAVGALLIWAAVAIWRSRD
jgi:hypothetical protein